MSARFRFDSRFMAVALKTKRPALECNSIMKTFFNKYNNARRDGDYGRKLA